MGASDPLNPYPSKPRITYRSDGTFKLVVFSDVHYGEAQHLSWGPLQDVHSDKVMRQALKAEGPNFVVINGDLITGDGTHRLVRQTLYTTSDSKTSDTFKENATSYIDVLLRPLIDTKIPFATTFGNHDNHRNISHRAELERIQKVAPLGYTRQASSTVGGRGGEGNYWVPVYASSESECCFNLFVHMTATADTNARACGKGKSPSLVLWFFDSRGGTDSDGKALPDWVDESVVPWIQDQTRHMNEVWGDAVKTGRQALVFAHIPPSVISVDESLPSDTLTGYTEN